MNRKYIIWGVIGVIVLLCIYYYNSLVGANQNVDGKWSKVEIQYQRRADLIPNLIETVKQYAKYEQTTLTEITEMRAKVGQASSVFNNKNASVDDKVGAVNTMESSLSRLLVIAENYPDLKANQSFLGLQDELAGTENRISVARNDFSDAVQKYNTSRQTFPRVIFANIMGFKERAYFASKAGSENAPSAKDLFDK